MLHTNDVSLSDIRLRTEVKWFSSVNKLILAVRCQVKSQFNRTTSNRNDQCVFAFNSINQ